MPITIPDSELSWRFDPSGGPGGQHANKASTRVELSWNLTASAAIDASTRERLLERLGSRAAGGVITVVVDDTRSQWRNRVIARRRLSDLIDDALRPERARVATRVPPGAKRRRLDRKRHRSGLKRMRARPDDED